VFVALALLLGGTGTATLGCEDDSVYRSGDPPPSIPPDSGLLEGGAGGPPANTDAGND
jgi:hypothetical protein